MAGVNPPRDSRRPWDEHSPVDAARPPRGFKREWNALPLPDAAAAYARAGIAILPAQPRDKKPACEHGVHDATCDAARVAAWWREQPDANIGLACGPNNLVVIDVDPAHGGLESWRKFDPRVATWTVLTGGGGFHQFFRVPPGVELKSSVSRVAPGIDIRAGWAYVVAPPSVHPSGRLYRWAEDEADLADLPESLLLRLTAAPAPPVPDFRLPPKLRIPSKEKEREEAYARAALERETERVRVAAQGTRNDTLNRAAFASGTLVGAGALHRDEAEESLRGAARESGLEAREIATTVRSGMEAGAKHPRVIKARGTSGGADSEAGRGLPAAGGYVPSLPEYARLTDADLSLAETAGQWLTDYIAFASQASSMTPRSFHEAAGLFAGSLAIARRLHLQVSDTTIYPNLYLLFVGESTLPRKTTAQKVLQRLIGLAGLGAFLLAGRQTPEALLIDLSTRVPATYDTWDDDLRRRWLEERAIAAQRGWLLSEASHLFDSFKRDYSSALLPLVLDLYDCPDEGPHSNTVTRGRQGIRQPYLSIFGATTYGAMAEHLKIRAHWHDGLWGRFALIGSAGKGEWKFWEERVECPPDLIARLHRLALELLPLPSARLELQERVGENGEKEKRRVVVVSPELPSCAVVLREQARDAWARYSRATSWDLISNDGAVPPAFQSSYGRLGTLVVKVAMILAAFDATALPVTVEARHVWRAQQIVEQWRVNLHSIMARAEQATSESLGSTILAVLGESGEGWTSRRELLRRMRKRWSDIEEAMHDLVEGAEVERRDTINRGGPKTEDYRLAPE